MLQIATSLSLLAMTCDCGYTNCSLLAMTWGMKNPDWSISRDLLCKL